MLSRRLPSSKGRAKFPIVVVTAFALLGGCEADTQGGVMIERRNGAYFITATLCTVPVRVLRIEAENDPNLLSRTTTDPTGSTRTWPLDLGLGGQDPRLVLEKGRMIAIAGNGSMATPGFIFTKADIDSLKDGQVLIESPPAESPTVVSAKSVDATYCSTP